MPVNENIYIMGVSLLSLFSWSRVKYLIVQKQFKIKQKQPFKKKSREKLWGTYQWLFLQWHWGVASGQGVGTLHGTLCQRCPPAPPPRAWVFPCWHWDPLTWLIYHLNKTKKRILSQVPLTRLNLGSRAWLPGFLFRFHYNDTHPGLAKLGWLQNIFNCVTTV